MVDKAFEEKIKEKEKENSEAELELSKIKDLTKKLLEELNNLKKRDKSSAAKTIEEIIQMLEKERTITEADGIFVDTSSIVREIISEAFPGGMGPLRGKQWWKKITGLDLTFDNGRAFVGVFLPCGWGYRRINIRKGDIIIVYRDMGSRRHHHPHVAMIRITEIDKEKNTFKYEIMATAEGYDWAAKLLRNNELLREIQKALQSQS